MVAVGSTTGTSTSSTLDAKSISHYAQITTIDDYDQQTQACTSERSASLKALLLDTLEDPEFTKFDQLPSTASRSALQSTEDTSSCGVSTAVVKPQAFSDPAAQPINDLIPSCFAGEQAAERRQSLHAAHFPQQDGSPIETRHRMCRVARAAERVQAVWRGLAQRRALKYGLLPSVKSFPPASEAHIVGAVVRFNVSSNWPMPMGHVASQDCTASGGHSKGGADYGLPTGGAHAPEGGAADGSLFVMPGAGFDVCTIIQAIGCPELKYDDGGLCAC